MTTIESENAEEYVVRDHGRARARPLADTRRRIARAGASESEVRCANVCVSASAAGRVRGRGTVGPSVRTAEARP